ncbi:monothiol glutaredoxin GRX4 NDAI_0B02300 [Naumovozyma dairenensis CBS 421]|uniref:Thioredoxin domain-containing protein n=1 Tax=Naumovozyma dairenensis (strain ATCC 10597 / BCRC 20456 / CBS 421 / NBRC 0211 / NRRL Y-12639) TaxID=1071378 RepID=G0W654_NAUDC|nr:hypothetical protein NDAI_0B02300 [Naumovozyma dairenensis CBS 421]CCD23265.1 hypothetical protein NDAI_0B02300 [Naumovozyma dairenensis CBS 421]
MPALQITTNEQFTQLTEASSPPDNKLIVLYFYTKWAEPCHSTNELFDALNDEFRNENALFLAIDADINNDIISNLNVSIVPYFIFIQNGKLLEQLSGEDPKKFVQILDQYLCISSTLSLSNLSLSNNNNNIYEYDSDNSADSNNSKYTIDSDYTSEDDIKHTKHFHNHMHHVDTQHLMNEDEFNLKLSKLVQAAPVMLFLKGTPSEPKCGYSRQMVKILRANKIRFGFFNVLSDNNVRINMKKFSDWPTFPQLYINGEFQGGLDIIKETLLDDPDYFFHTLQSSPTGGGTINPQIPSSL